MKRQYGEGCSMVRRQKPQFAQIADQLRDWIESGNYRPGDRLPSEPELATQLGVSRVTINNAVNQLRTAGLVKVVRGRGTFVRRVPPIHRHAQQRFDSRGHGVGAYDVEVRALGHVPSAEVAITHDVPAPREIAEILGVAEGTTCVVRRRRMLADGEPTQLANTYLLPKVAERANLMEIVTGPGGTYERLAQVGMKPVRFTESVDVISATDENAELLDIDTGSPLLRIVHAAWTEDQHSPAVTVHLMPSAQWVLHYEWDASDS